MPHRSRPTRAPAPRRVRRTREDAERQILDAAEDFLAEHEFRDLTVDAVTKRVGMARSAFYNYFPDRNALLYALLEGVTAEFEEAIRPWLDGKDWPEGSPSAVLQEGAIVYARHGRLLGALHAASFHDPAIREFYAGVINGLADLCVKALRRDIRRGRADVPSPKDVVYALNWMNAGLMADRLGGPDPASPRAVGRTMGFIWERTFYGTARD